MAKRLRSSYARHTPRQFGSFDVNWSLPNYTWAILAIANSLASSVSLALVRLLCGHMRGCSSADDPFPIHWFVLLAKELLGVTPDLSPVHCQRIIRILEDTIRSDASITTASEGIVYIFNSFYEVNEIPSSLTDAEQEAVAQRIAFTIETFPSALVHHMCVEFEIPDGVREKTRMIGQRLLLAVDDHQEEDDDDAGEDDEDSQESDTDSGEDDEDDEDEGDAETEPEEKYRIAPPSDLICPITLTLFKDPWTTEDGFTFERFAIKKWLKSHSTSPITNNVVTRTLVPNMLVRSMCNRWKEDHRCTTPTQ